MTASAVVGRQAAQPRVGRFGPASRAVLWGAGLFLASLVGLEAYRFTLPTDGWRLAPPVESPVFVEDLLGGGTGVLPGDRLLAVDGVPFPLLMLEAVSLRRPGLDLAVGGETTYTVLRGDAEVDVAVTPRRWDAAGIALAAWRAVSDAPMGGVYRWLAWALAAYVFFRRPDLRSAQLLLLLETVMVGVVVTYTVAPVSVADVLSPALFYAARFAGDLFTWLLVPPLGLHLILAFPGSRPVPAWALLAVYLVPWAVLAVVWVWGLVPLVPLMTGAYSALGFAAVALLVRRHGSGPERASVRWFAFAFGVSNLLSALFWLGESGLVTHVPLVHAVVIDHCLCDLAYVAGFAIAVLWHGLFDADAVIGRALVYGGLTVAVVGVYVALVSGVGSLLAVDAGLPLSLLATVTAALLLAPLRWRLQRAANRLLYGFRDEPYEVLTRLGERLRAAPQVGAALHDVTRAVAEALRLPFAAVRLGAVTATSHGEPRPVSESFPLSHGGQVLGELVVSPRQAEGRLSAADRRLLSALAAQVGTVAHALALEADLERARLRSLEVREEERRRLGGDLHDDVGHRLALLSRRARDAAALVDPDPEAAKAALAALEAEVRSVTERVRSLAHRLHPPELAVLGLVGAIRERVEALGAPGGAAFALEADDLGAVPAAVELAAYHVVQEALSNVVKHAGASRCTVSVRVVDAPRDAGATALARRYLELEVRDDGRGFRGRPDGGASLGGASGGGASLGGAPGAEDAPHAGLGLVSMRGRAREVGGTLVVESPDGGGTVVRATLPWPET